MYGYMQFKNPDITGSVGRFNDGIAVPVQLEADYTDWVRILAYSWGIRRNGKVHFLDAGNGKIGSDSWNPSHFTDFTFIHMLDHAAPLFMAKIGHKINSVSLRLLHQFIKDEKPVILLEITMKNVLIASQKISTISLPLNLQGRMPAHIDMEGQIVQTVVLRTNLENSEVKVKYNNYSADGTSKGIIEKTYSHQ